MPASPVRGGLLRNEALSLGVVLGVGFSATGLAWLLANRVLYLDQFASKLNLALAIAFGLLSLVPICRFIKSPGRSFLCGITAWTILTATYSVTELLMPGIGLSAFQLFVLGGVVFAPLAALHWIVSLIIVPRDQQSVATERRRLP